MAGPRGYNSYRGGRHSVWKVILAIALILVILAAAGFMLLQKYLVYDESGTPHLQLPESSASSAVSSGSGGGDADSDAPLNITIDEPEQSDITGVQLASDPSLWASQLAGLTPEQNAVCVTMRASGGAVQYTSASASTTAGAVTAATAAAADAALPALLASDVRHIARVSCLRDSAAALANLDSMALKNTGGYVFYDGNNENWLDPSKEATVAYLCALAKECADLGFDEILLTDLTYPTVGKVNKIDYNGADQAQALSALVAAIKTAVGDSVRVTVEVPASVILTGADATAGLNLSALTSAADGIYSPLTADQLEQVPDTLWKSGFVPELTGEAGKLAGSPLLLLPA